MANVSQAYWDELRARAYPEDRGADLAAVATALKVFFLWGAFLGVLGGLALGYVLLRLNPEWLLWTFGLRALGG